ncbi:FadR/GntR family transcriptional regulator [Mesorhizobium sp. B2-1-1]|uniref:FadR/GntR family transcriptional regulator n=1 Tax=Mesorhizobium sp. B2-1-1 TaxID=2589974 RepID=UPI001FEEC826|nr:FCD domain-containing protein [Mesorhizobium sp. B2-1-1]
MLARRIASSGVAGGQGPSEQQILQEFGVSRAVAREALKILASLDMIEIAQGRRVVLRPADEWDYLSPLLIDWLPPEQTREILAEAHATRIIIEPAITAIAAKHMTKENLERLGTLLAAMSASEDNADAYLKLDLDFHMEICRAAKNRILDRFMYSSRWWQMASRRISNQVPHALPSATEMHRAIYEALVARDAKRAEEAMRRHLKITTAVGLPP